MNLGKSIKTIREYKKLSQKAASALIGMSPQQLSALERADEIRVSTLKKIAKAYGVHPVIIGWLASEESDVPKKKKAIYGELKPLMDNVIKDLLGNKKDSK